jgi:hypothetical protein
LVTARNCHRSTGRDEALCHAHADATIAAGDKGDPTREIEKFYDTLPVLMWLKGATIGSLLCTPAQRKKSRLTNIQ